MQHHPSLFVFNIEQQGQTPNKEKAREVKLCDRHNFKQHKSTLETHTAHVAT